MYQALTLLNSPSLSLSLARKVTCEARDLKPDTETGKEGGGADGTGEGEGNSVLAEAASTSKGKGCQCESGSPTGRLSRRYNFYLTGFFSILDRGTTDTLMSYEDSKMSLPESILNWVTGSAIPGTLDTLAAEAKKRRA